MLSKGNILNEKYQLIREIGKGGMSTVWLVRDLKLNKDWALKEIDKRSDEYKAVVKPDGTLTEVEILGQLDHPNAPRVVDIYDSEDTICIVMDYIDGESLQRILNREGAQSQELVASWMIDTCKLLYYLHKKQIIYRDMKPSNIILTREGLIKIVDYGIAKIVKDKVYFDNSALGTNGYASPEHVSKATDEKSDIYTVGMTMYALLTGDSPTRKGFRLVPIRKHNPELSPGLEQIIIKCTMKDPDDRYQNMAGLIDALENYKKLDPSYVKTLRRKIRISKVMTAVSLLTIALGALTFEAGYLNQKKAYDEYLSVSHSAAAQAESYKEAINLMPYKADAYIALTELYQGEGLSKDKFNELLTLEREYEKAVGNLPPLLRSNNYEELNYLLGYSYVVSSTEALISPAAERLMAASECFKRASDDTNALGSKYSACNALYNLGAFYSLYAQNEKVDSSIAIQAASSLSSLMQSTRVSFGKGANKLNLSTYVVILEFIKDNGDVLINSGLSRDTLKKFESQIVEEIKDQKCADEIEAALVEKVMFLLSNAN